MKLKYTLVFTIISFFIATAGFAQQYSDQEIGFDVSKITASLKEKGATEGDIDFEISLLRRMHTNQYIQIKQNEKQTLIDTKAKASTKKSALIADISSTEKAALQALYNSTNGSNWINKQGWDFSTPVTTWDGTNGWYGITVTNGAITSINLSGNNLVGPLPSEIGNLLNLNYLYLAANELNGTIPEQIGNLSNLIHLSLYSNNFSGSIPTSIGNLNKLVYLFLGNNQLTGSIPVEIGNLSKLTYLTIYHNQLTGAIPLAIYSLPNLDTLFLEYNNLSGSISDNIRNLSKLKFLNLSNNQLTGSIPTGIGNLYYNLLEVYFRNNQLSGPIPTEILLYNLSSLYLDNNQLSGPIPYNIDRLRNIGLLYLDHNQFTGTIPAAIGNLPEAIHINLSNNKLTGTIPVEIGGLPRIQMLDLSFNQLTGTIPSEIGNLIWMRSLFLNNNQFNGTIPSSLTQLTLLGNFYINNNKFRFIDFANEYQTYKNFYGFKYVDQAKIDTKERLNVDIGSSATLTMCKDNRYTNNDTFQWYKGKFPDGELINGATNREYTISNINASHEGDYYCLSSHPEITITSNQDRNLVLEREPITLKIACSTEETGGAIKPLNNAFYANTNIVFYLDSNNPDLIYNWTFYNLDNTYDRTYEGNNISKLYDTPGTYKINLVVTGSNGCMATIEKTVVITENPNCITIPGNIITSTPEVIVNRNTTFSFDSSDSNSTYKWTFSALGESTIFTSKIVDYKFLFPKTYNVRLDVIDSNGCKGVFQKTVEVKTGPLLCEQVTQSGRIYITVGNDSDLYNSAQVNVNETTNVTFPINTYGPSYDIEYKWSLYNENNQLLDSGTNLNFPITLTKGGLYKVVLDLQDHTSGCVNQLTRSIVAVIPNSCAQSNQQSPIVKKLLVDLLKNLISRSMTGETDTQINNSPANAEFNALKPYITSDLKDKIYNFKTTTNQSNEFTGLDFSFSSDRASDIHISIPHNLKYVQGMSIESQLLPLIESKLYINLNQFVSSNQYLISCYSESSGYCSLGSEIRFIDFCPSECDSLLAAVKVTPESPALNNAANFSVETTATNLTYNWTFYNPDNSIKGTQNSAIASQTFTIPGNYKAVVNVTDSNNCTTTITKQINIVTPSCVAATGTIKTSSPNVFVGANTTFSFETTATNLTYEWTLYKDVNTSVSTSNTSTAYMSYQTPGTYNVKLVVTDVNGCKNTFRKTVVVTTKPPCVDIVGEIKTANPIVTQYENTTFSFETTATNLRYDWTFHSLNNTPLLVTSESNPTVTYPYNNSYKITLRVYDENDCATEITKYILVQKACPPIIASINGPSTVATNEVANFGYTTTANSGSISHKWTFYNLDGSIRSTSISNAVSKDYTSPGTYRINLEITDLFNYGCKTSIDKTVTVTGECSIPGTMESNPDDTGIVYNQWVAFRFETSATDLKYEWTITKPQSSTPEISSEKNGYCYFDQTGDYKIALKVSDYEGCSKTIEKTYNIVYDCRWSEFNGYVANSNYNTYVVINKPLTYQFYPYGNSNLDGMELLWQLVNQDGEVLSTSTTKEFNVTPTAVGQYKIIFKTTDANGCPFESNVDMHVLEPCEYREEYLDGFIGFENENIKDLLTIQSNQPKELLFNPRYETGGLYSYRWKIYNANDELVESGNNDKLSLTLSNPGLYKIKLEIENEYGCILYFSKSIKCLIENSCTNNNPKSQIVKTLYIGLLKNLISRSLSNETDEHINASNTTKEFTSLMPYITNRIGNKIYNYATTRNEQGKLTSVMFSFSPDRDYDVQIFIKKGLWNYDSTIDGTLTEFANRFESELYLDLSQYTSSSDYLISCYAQDVEHVAPQSAQKIKKLSTTTSSTSNNCYKATEVRFIDFCPTEACVPTDGVIQTGNILLLPPVPPGQSAKKIGSRL